MVRVQKPRLSLKTRFGKLLPRTLMAKSRAILQSKKNLIVKTAVIGVPKPIVKPALETGVSTVTVKDIDLWQWHTTSPGPAIIDQFFVDDYYFVPHGFVMLFDATDKRVCQPDTYGSPPNTLDKIVIRPAGVAYPGDLAPGNGAKKVTIGLNFIAGPVMSNVDNVDFSTGWIIVTKGDFVIAYTRAAVTSVTVEPM